MENPTASSLSQYEAQLLSQTNERYLFYQKNMSNDGQGHSPEALHYVPLACVITERIDHTVNTVMDRNNTAFANSMDQFYKDFVAGMMNLQQHMEERFNRVDRLLERRFALLEEKIDKSEAVLMDDFDDKLEGHIAVTRGDFEMVLGHQLKNVQKELTTVIQNSDARPVLNEMQVVMADAVSHISFTEERTADILAMVDTLDCANIATIDALESMEESLLSRNGMILATALTGLEQRIIANNSNTNDVMESLKGSIKEVEKSAVAQVKAVESQIKSTQNTIQQHLIDIGSRTFAILDECKANGTNAQANTGARSTLSSDSCTTPVPAQSAPDKPNWDEKRSRDIKFGIVHRITRGLTTYALRPGRAVKDIQESDLPVIDAYLRELETFGGVDLHMYNDLGMDRLLRKIATLVNFPRADADYSIRKRATKLRTSMREKLRLGIDDEEAEEVDNESEASRLKLGSE